MEASFPQFSLLPAELRCKVWRYALPQRTVFFRLKMDMDAWNWASESDWWAHYVLTGDHKSATATTTTTQQLPSLLLVNHEARFESAKAYRQLTIDKAVLKRCLSNEFVVDSSLERMRNLKKTPRLNVDNDILEWAHVKRWSRNNPARCSALFLAASMSVQHVVVEYDHYLHTSLLSLALSVMDVESPLKSLTLKVFDASVQKQVTYRIAAVSDRVPVIRDQEQLSGILRRRHADDDDDDYQDDGCEGLLPSPEVVRSWRWVDMVDEQDRTSFNLSLQNDVALFMHRISLFEQRDDDAMRRHRIDIVPFHGICSPQHGLP
ncbi:hypothetical protein G7054_g8603 [Neopestalotiopsis clavispora]|nr:hypothetical protein G7054_g8603 [Neopestalotiopsis clavispora]